MLFKPAGDVSSLVVGLCVEDALTGELWEDSNDLLACAWYKQSSLFSE